MPEVEIKIGGRAFEVFCQDGEEHYLHAAAKMLDVEASVLAGQIGRLPEARMLLMAGLMLADKTAGLEDKLREMQVQLADKEAELSRMAARLVVGYIGTGLHLARPSALQPVTQNCSER